MIIATYIGSAIANVARRIEMIPIIVTNAELKVDILLTCENNPVIPIISNINPTI